MKVLQINSHVNSGSTGRIAEDIGKVLLRNGHESVIAYGRQKNHSKSKSIKIGKKFDILNHVLLTKIFGKHGFGSFNATKKFIKEIEKISPDLICLHNLHGYYININLLFKYLKLRQIPVLWILYDCWAFTGHCTYFDDVMCSKWETQCYNCPKYKNYPNSWVDNSEKSFLAKKELFTTNNNIHLLVHSHWLASLVKKSFLKNRPIHVISSAIDLELFKPVFKSIAQKYGIENKYIILGCTYIWTERKGLNDLIKLSQLLSEDYQMVIIGLNRYQIEMIPKSILIIERTENISELSEWFSAAQAYVNPTYQDNFPSTNMEALACGTPVITYNTGGSPEAIDAETGFVVNKGDINGLKEAIENVVSKGKKNYIEKCRKRAEMLFDKEKVFTKYIDLFESLR